MGNDRINMLGTSKLSIHNKETEFFVARNDFPIDIDGILGLNFLKHQKALNNIKNDRIVLSNKRYPIVCNLNITSRETILKTHLRFDHMNNEEKSGIWAILRKHTELFYLPGDDLPFLPNVEHEIKTDTEEPIFKKQYRRDREEHKIVRKLVREQLEKGIIEESNSPYSAPCHAVKKKIDASGKIKHRLVIDYSNLNKHTPADRHPIPFSAELLDGLGACKYFSALDMAAGFHQIKISKNSRHKTAFFSPDGHHQYVRLPMGLRNSPSTFCRAINNILRGLAYKICFVYLDDIIIFGKTLKEHNENLITRKVSSTRRETPAG